jgi:hypothetical protein
MYIPRLLILSLLISACVAPTAAQSPSDNIPGSFYSEPLGVLPPDALASLPLIPIQLPIDIDIDRLYLPHAKSDAAGASEHDWTFKPWPQSRARVLTQSVLTQKDATCYSMRSYRVTRDDPASDTTRLVGYSTCQPSTRFQVKEANERQEIVPR